MHHLWVTNQRDGTTKHCSHCGAERSTSGAFAVGPCPGPTDAAQPELQAHVSKLEERLVELQARVESAGSGYGSAAFVFALFAGLALYAWALGH